MLRTIGICLLLYTAVALNIGDAKVRYRRVLGDKTRTECIFTQRQTDQGRSITSVTVRGTTIMTVTARYDREDRLTGAEATRAKGDMKKTVRVTVAGNKAKVMRDGQETQEFEVPAGVIVTCAPDWTDTFLLCQRYDLKKGGKQEFAGLWIHPEQSAQRLTFTIERVGTDRIDHEGKKVNLDRFLIRIRNNSEYVAWADDAGRMIKLISLPGKENAGTVLILTGFEKGAGKLRSGR